MGTVVSYLYPLLKTIAGMAILIVSSFILTLTIEDIGKRGKFSDSFTGSVISPIFTTLPPLVVIILALVVIGSEPGSEIAAGTIIGEPFMVSAVGFPIVAITLLISKRRGRQEELDAVLPKMFIFMGLVFPIMLIPLFFNLLAIRISVAILLVFLYIVFLRFIKGGARNEEAIDAKIADLRLLILIAISGMVFLLAGSAVLVTGINSLALKANVNHELLTILIVPIGTIAPETMNSLIWASRGKTNLALGALTGEEMVFATLYPALGILASQWIITVDGILAIALTSFFSILIGLISLKFRNALFVFLIFFASFVTFLIFIY